MRRAVYSLSSTTLIPLIAWFDKTNILNKVCSRSNWLIDWFDWTDSFYSWPSFLVSTWDRIALSQVAATWDSREFVRLIAWLAAFLCSWIILSQYFFPAFTRLFASVFFCKLTRDGLIGEGCTHYRRVLGYRGSHVDFVRETRCKIVVNGTE